MTFLHCGRTVVRIKTKLGMQVGLGPGHIVLDGDRGNSVTICMLMNDTQLLKRVCLTDIPVVIDRLQRCVQEIHGRCASRAFAAEPCQNRADLVWINDQYP